MLLVTIGLLFGLAILLWCLVLTVVHRDSAWGGHGTLAADRREVGPMRYRSHAA